MKTQIPMTGGAMPETAPTFCTIFIQKFCMPFGSNTAH